MTVPTETPPEGVDYSRKWFVLIAIAMAIFLGTVDGSIVNVALPTLVDEFGTTFGVAQWVVLAYLLTQTTLTLMFGRLGDMMGKKPIFTAGFGVFTVGSVLAGLSPTIEFLIAARVVQAVGASMIFALGFAITTESFPPSERGKALGINGTTVSLGIMAGPIIGGMILESTDWRWIFFVNLPIGIIGTMTAIKFVPNTKPKGKQRFDFLGAGTFFVGLLSLLLALTMGQGMGFTDPLILGLFALSIVTMAGFIAVERRVSQPMLNLALFKNRDLTVNLITGFIGFFALSGMILLLPFYLTDVIGLSPRGIGFVLGAIPITMGIVAPISGTLSDRIGSRPVTAAGLALMTVAYGMAGFWLEGATTALIVVIVGLIIGLGFGIFQSPNNSAILGSVPQNQLGVTSGMLTINRTTASVTGIAVLGALWAARTALYASGGEVADAPATAQAAALADTMIVATILLGTALFLALWAWKSKRHADA
ncbi:MAG: DHA2 family efflux MFS transporter permease subunit [Actinomycetota bacterium]|nr:DHA2 family efflux MFS transporter permease subunit [Actinomycetota bacterium]